MDAISQIENKTMSLLARDPNIEVENVPSAQCITLPMHVDTAPFDNPDVRMALKLAIDREDMIEKIAFGAAMIGNDFHHSRAMPYWLDDIPQREYDPDQAESLLKKAGIEDLSVSIHAAKSITNGAIDALTPYHIIRALMVFAAVIQPRQPVGRRASRCPS